MDPNKTPLERAFELARSGQYQSVEEVKRALKGEGFSTDQLTGQVLSRQLRGFIEQAKQSTT